MFCEVLSDQTILSKNLTDPTVFKNSASRLSATCSFTETYHYCNIVSVVEGEGTIAAEKVLLCAEEAFQVARVIPHQLRHMIQPIVL